MGNGSTSTDDVTANLENALAGESVESSTTETTEAKEATSTEESTEDGAETEKGKGENRIPQSRLNEVIEARKTQEQRATTAEAELAEANKALATMTELLESKEADSQTLDAIRGYINDPDMKAHVEAIDAKLRGVELEVETGDISPEQAAEKNRTLIEQHKTEMADLIADQQADLLLARADTIADKLIEALPDEYTEKDLAVIRHIWPDKVDWEAAAASPDSLQSELSKSFQETIELFGEPRGALTSKETTENTEETVAETPTPEEELKELLDKPWAKVNSEQTKTGSTKVSAELSDAEFAADMAKAMKIANRS